MHSQSHSRTFHHLPHLFPASSNLLYLYLYGFAYSGHFMCICSCSVAFCVWLLSLDVMHSGLEQLPWSELSPLAGWTVSSPTPPQGLCMPVTAVICGRYASCYYRHICPGVSVGICLHFSLVIPSRGAEPEEPPDLVCHHALGHVTSPQVSEP